MSKLYTISIIAKKSINFIDLQNIVSNKLKEKINIFQSIEQVKIKEKHLNIFIVDLSNNIVEKELKNLSKSFIEESFFFALFEKKKKLSIGKNFVFIEVPFKVDTLLSRIEVCIKTFTSVPLPKIGNYLYSYVESSLTTRTKKVFIDLTDMENNFLNFLLKQNKPIEKKVILKEVWGHQKILETHTLESLVYRLRNKIEKDPKNPSILISVGNKYCISS